MKHKYNNKIYRVFNKKGKYQQSYSPQLKDAYSWAIDCAVITNGEVHEVTLNEYGFEETSVKVYPSKKTK